MGKQPNKVQVMKMACNKYLNTKVTQQAAKLKK